MHDSEEPLSPGQWEAFRRKMGYSHEELARFQADPRGVYVLEHAARLNAWTIVAKVVASHGCAAGHQVGCRFYFSPNGVYLAKEGPPETCLQILTAAAPAVAAMQERIISGLSPDPYLFHHVGCLDVGLACGGWGHVALRLYAEPRTS